MRSFEVKINRKVAKAAMRSALAAHASSGTLALLDATMFSEPSTTQAASVLADWGKELPAVVVATDEEQDVVKSFRNLDRVAVVSPSELEVAAVVWARSLVVTQGALETVERRAQ
jgi:large subunit ribosomal protein L4